MSRKVTNKRLSKNRPLGWRVHMRVFIGVVLCVQLTQSLSAHRLNLITTDIQWRAEDQVLDVSHRLHLEDALTLLATLGARDGVLDLEASARLLNYIEQRFELRTKGGVLALEPFGAHLQGDSLFVFQRVSVNQLPQALEVRNLLMFDMEPAMKNQVNWRVGELVRSHSGHRHAPVAWLSLAPAPEAAQ